MYGMGGGGNWGGQWGGNNAGQTPNSNTRMPKQNMNHHQQQQQNTLFKQNQTTRVPSFNQNVSHQQSLFLQQQQQQQLPLQNMYNVQQQQPQPMQNMYNMQQQPMQNLYLQQQLLMQSQMHIGGGVATNNRGQNMPQLAVGIGAYPQQQTSQPQPLGVNALVNPNGVPFYQQQPQQKQVNPFMQQQQTFSQQWETPGQKQQTSNNPSGAPNQNDLKNYSQGSISQFGNIQQYGANFNTQSNLSRDAAGSTAPPAPPPPVPVEQPQQHNPPPPPPTQNYAVSQNANLLQENESTETKKNIVSTNLPGLLDIISGNTKKGKDPSGIPGFGDLDDVTFSSKSHPEEVPKTKVLLETDKTDTSGKSTTNLHSVGESQFTSDDVQIVEEPVLHHKVPDAMKPSSPSVVGDTQSNVSSSGGGTGLDVSFGSEESTSGGSSNFNRSTLKAFDRKFREWEKEFEDWKSASANHPDRVAYGKFMGQWETWREQLVRQRKFIIDNMTKDKPVNTEANQGNVEVSNSSEQSNVSKNLFRDRSHVESEQQPNTLIPRPRPQPATPNAPGGEKEFEQKKPKVDECRDLSKLIRNPFAVLGSGNSAASSMWHNSNAPNSSAFAGSHKSHLEGNQKEGTNNFTGSVPRVPALIEKPNQNIQNPNNLRRPPSPVERVSRQPRALHPDSEFFGESSSSSSRVQSSFEGGNRNSSNNSGNFGDRQESGSSTLLPTTKAPVGENPFSSQPRRNFGELIGSSDPQKLVKPMEPWNIFGGSNRATVPQQDENPFVQARGNNPFSVAGVTQNPFKNPFESASSGNRPQDQPQRRERDSIDNINSRFSSSASAPRNQTSSFTKENDFRFESNRQYETQRRELAPPQSQSNQMSQSFGQFFRREQRPSAEDKPSLSLGGMRRPGFENDQHESYSPAVIDYGHGEKQSPSFPPMFKGNLSQPQPVDDYEDEDDTTTGVTIDYGHGSRAPVLTNTSHLVGQANIRDRMPDTFTRKEPDYDQEDYLRYAEREERNVYEQSGPPRREQRIAPPEFVDRDQFDYSKGHRAPPYDEYSYPPRPHGYPYADDPVDPYFRPADSLPHVRPSKPLFPIGDYEVPSRIAPDLHSLESSPYPLSQPVELRQAPPRDLLEPISPDGSPISSRGSREVSEKPRDRVRNRDAPVERERSRDVQESRAKSRDAGDLLDEIVRDRERSRERDTRRKERSTSRVRARSRSRDRDRVSRDPKHSSRNSRNDSPKRNRDIGVSPRRRRDDSPSRRERVRRDRTRSPVNIDGDRRHTSSRNPVEQPIRRKSPSPNHRRGILRAEEILNMPGRKKRPPQIVIIMRGLPGSGKTHVAKIIKDKEVQLNESAPRILSLDDYFMTETEKTKKDPATGKDVKEKVSIYEYDSSKESKYRDELFRAFRKTIEGGLYPMIIVDMVNDRIRHFQEMSNFATAKRFQVYIAELEADVEECAKRNTHNRTLEQIKKLHRNWERTPASLTKLDIRTLLQDDSIQDVQMEDVSDIEDLDDLGADGKPEVEIIDPEEEDEPWAVSKWETSEDKLNKLDGLGRKRKSADSEDENGVQLSMEQWLQDHLPEDYSVREETVPGKKRVRWADIEERREQERARKYGFVAGNTDWNRLMDPTFGGSALTKTKYI